MKQACCNYGVWSSISSHQWKAIRIWRCIKPPTPTPTPKRKVCFTLCIAKNTSASRHLITVISLSLSLHSHFLLVSLFQFPPLYHSPAPPQTNTHTHSHPHKCTDTHYSSSCCPGSGSISFFFPVTSITALLFQLLASTKIIPIYPTGCSRSRFRLSDLLRGMTDSCFPLFKENWIHQLLLNGCIQAFDHTPSNTLVGVCGVFKCVFAHMYAA